MIDHDKRERDRRHDAKRKALPYRGWYKTPEWRAKAAAQLKVEPWCRFCAKAGKKTKAAIVDHVERHGGNQTKFWAGALQSLCRHCHDSVKQSMERGSKAGCDASGMPIDPSHPWS